VGLFRFSIDASISPPHRVDAHTIFGIRSSGHGTYALDPGCTWLLRTRTSEVTRVTLPNAHHNILINLVPFEVLVKCSDGGAWH